MNQKIGFYINLVQRCYQEPLLTSGIMQTAQLQIANLLGTLTMPQLKDLIWLFSFKDRNEKWLPMSNITE